MEQHIILVAALERKGGGPGVPQLSISGPSPRPVFTPRWMAVRSWEAQARAVRPESPVVIRCRAGQRYVVVNLANRAMEVDTIEPYGSREEFKLAAPLPVGGFVRLEAADSRVRLQ